MVHAELQDPGHGLGMDAVTGRIQNDEIRFLFYLINDFQHIAGNETAVAKSIDCGVFFGRFDGFSWVMVPVPQ